MPHPRIVELTEYAANARAELLAAVERVPAELRARRVDARSWTIGEVLDHLAIVEAGVAQLVERRVARAREKGVGPDPETGSVLGALDRLNLIGNPDRRDAPENVRPRTGADPTGALGALAESRRRFLAALDGAEGVSLAELRATHATLGDLDLYEWVLFVAQHEVRHRRQIEAIAERLRATGGVRHELDLALAPWRLAVCRLDASEPLPPWAGGAGEFLCIARTPDELSVVCDEALVPEGVRCERGYSAVRVVGPLPFDLVGVFTSVVEPLAADGISIFAISTFDTDYVLLKERDLPRALQALRGAGHTVGEPST